MAKSAQSKTSPKIKINILHPQGEPLEITTKFLKWLTGYGRFIIIIVEIVVLICFFVKFKLDADSKNLDKQIEDVSAQIQSHADDEKMIKQVQIKLTQIKQNYDNAPSWTDTINKISERLPQSIKLTSINFDHTQASKILQFKISGTTNNNSDIGFLLTSLREDNLDEKDRSFTGINLDGITYDQGKLNFIVSGSTK